jgi:hypothetical protein
MSALADRTPIDAIGVYEVRYWDRPQRTDVTVRMFEDRQEAEACSRRGNDAGTSTGSRFYVVEHVLHLRKPGDERTA